MLNHFAMHSQEFETEKAISSLLKASLRDYSIKELLTEILAVLTKISWLNVFPQGAIFLANGKEELVLLAHHKLAPELQNLCATIKIGSCLCGLAAKEKKIIFNNCVNEDHTITFESMKPHGHYNIPLVKDDKLLGVVVLYVPHGHKQQKNETLFMEMLGDTISSIIAKKILEEQLKISHYEIAESQSETMRRLLAASEFRDNETGMHIKRMTEYAVAIGKQLHLSAQDMALLQQGAPMHDVGKIGIPDTILLKPGALTKEEFSIMKTHTVIGGDLLKGSSDFLRAGREIALTHHEKWNGSRYPKGLKGSEIPLFGRICAIADVFDALTSDRPYKKKWPLKKAFQFMSENAGSHFDPVLITHFFNAKEEILRIHAIYQDEIIEQDQTLGFEYDSNNTGFFLWDDSLSVGIDIIDSQHKYLINIANDLYSKMILNDGAGAHAIMPALKLLMDYTEIHFSQEEKIMQDCNYPNLQSHKLIHLEFVEKLNYFRQCIKEYPLVISQEIVFFLRDWLIKHIQGEDTRIRNYLST